MERPGRYRELAPPSGLAGLVRTLWIQSTGADPAPQRHLPTGGFELHFPVGRIPRLVGPLTRAKVEILPPGLTVVGARFWPGVARRLLGVPADELVDLVTSLDDISPDWSVLAARMAETSSDTAAVSLLQDELLHRRLHTPPADCLVRAAVQRLMPWRPVGLLALTRDLSISESQLRRRFQSAVGVGPKALQRTLRFQGYLALAQSSNSARRIADLAADAGYADHAHLSRECLRLTARTPRELLGEIEGLCRCDHDHAASYQAFLAARPRAVVRSS